MFLALMLVTLFSKYVSATLYANFCDVGFYFIIITLQFNGIEMSI